MDIRPPDASVGRIPQDALAVEVVAVDHLFGAMGFG
jgi:hypothetical protein